MNDLKTGPDDWAMSNRRNTLRLGYRTFAWVATMAVAAFGPRFLWDYATLPATLGVLVNLAVGLVCGLCYELLEDIRLIALEPEISHLVMLMSLTFLVSMIVGHRRYQ